METLEIILIICSILILSIVINISKNIQLIKRNLHINTEKYMNLNIPVPKDLKKNYLNFVSYENIEPSYLCPTSYTGKITKYDCTSKSDCGPAEVCINDGVRSYCNCSIFNDCYENAIC